MRHRKNMKKHLRVAILLALLPLLPGLIGCSTITLYPIAKQDIVVMRKGEAYTPDKDGFFLSTLYMQEVMKAKVEKVNLK
jgi:hypothetical protein